MQGNRVVLGFCFGGIGWLTLVSFGTSLAMGEPAVALQTSPPCPSENVARVYHPRPVLRLGSLNGCGTQQFPTFMRDAWYASALAGADQLGVISMNAHGQIVGTFLVQDGVGCVPRPFIWLPVGAYGLAAGAHDLMSYVVGTSASTPGYALDLTDDGLVVGGSGGIPEVTGSTCRATAWRLHTSAAMPHIEMIDLDPIATTPFRWSIAVAAEPFPDLKPVEIVGTGAKICDGFRTNAKFRLTGAAASTITDAQPSNFFNSYFVNGLRSWACDVVNGMAPVGSFDMPSPMSLAEHPPCPLDGPTIFGCAFPYWCGAQFYGSGLVEFRRDATFPHSISDGQITGVRSISQEGGMVAGFVEPHLGTCGQQGALWPYSEPGHARKLPSPNGFPGATAQRWRHMPSGCGTDVVLGWSTKYEPALGIIWSRCAGATDWDFCGWKAGSLTPSGTEGFEILQMYEINELGEVIVIVRDDVSAPSARGYYLAVFGKAGDFNHDWRIGAPDLSMLFNVWGSTQHMEQDLDQNGVVDALDLAILLQMWSDTERVPLRLPCGGTFCLPEIARAAPPCAGLELALAAFGYDCCADFRASVPTMDGPCLNAMCETMSAIIQFVGEE